MAIVVLHIKDKKKYVLIGTGFGAYKSTRPSVLGGSLFPHEDMGEIPVAAVTDSKGKIHWFLTEDLQIIEIDGENPTEILKEENTVTKETNHEITEIEYCPACNFKVSVNDKECPSCELTLLYKDE
jgi:rubrerythrin